MTTLLVPTVTALVAASATWALVAGLDDIWRVLLGLAAGAAAGGVAAVAAHKRLYRPIQQRLLAHDGRFDDRELTPRVSSASIDETLRTVLKRHEARLAVREAALTAEINQRASAAEASKARAREASEALAGQVDEHTRALRRRTERLVYLLQQLGGPLEATRATIEVLLGSGLSEAQAVVARAVAQGVEGFDEVLELCRANPARGVAEFSLLHSEFHLCESLGDALQAHAAEAERKGLELVLRVAGHLPTRLEGDLVRLRQVLSTFVGNAIRRAAGGRISVNVGLRGGTPRDPEDRRRCLEVVVEDNGAVVSEARARHLFTADIVPAPGDAPAGDAPLGLAVASALLQGVGGSAWLESSSFGATRFAFTFVAAKPKNATVTTMYGRGRLADKSVLVVDDDTTSRSTLCEQLTSWGLLPTAAGSGSEALAALAAAARSERPYDLVVVDQRMPEMDGVQLLRTIRGERSIGDQKVVLLSGFADLKIPLTADVEGQISARVAKPVNPERLLKAVIETLRPPRAEPQVAAPTLQSPFSKRAVTVLVAEDNPVNQVFTVKILQKRGFHVTVANNGADAIDAIDNSPTPFDVLLFDIQMPVMDGLEATALIREREAETGDHRPIIAVTAHAISGERQRCLDAGMDDYVPKPIVEEQLMAAIYFALPPEVQSHIPWRPPDKDDGQVGRVFDDQKVLDFVAGDADFLQSLVELFAKTSPTQMKAISEAIQNKDCTTLQSAAHRFKGSVSNFGAHRAAKWAHTLEKMGGDGEIEQAHDAYYHLQREVDALRDSLKAFAARHR